MIYPLDNSFEVLYLISAIFQNLNGMLTSTLIYVFHIGRYGTREKLLSLHHK
jgi:hypothetical protein